MQPEEKAILQVKYKSLPIGKLSDVELLLHAQGLLLRIHVITGWKIPESDELLNILDDQFTKKLKESYSECNPDEIEYAFRNYGTQVKDWGKTLNLNLIDTVMNLYLSHRRDISQYEERLTSPKGIDYKPTPEELQNGNRELIQLRYTAFLAGNTEITFLPEFGVQQLAADGFTDADIWQDFLKEALRYQKSEIFKARELLMIEGKTEHSKDAAQRIADLKETDETIITIAKKLALLFCFEQFKKAGAESIYKPE